MRRSPGRCLPKFSSVTPTRWTKCFSAGNPVCCATAACRTRGPVCSCSKEIKACLEDSASSWPSFPGSARLGSALLARPATDCFDWFGSAQPACPAIDRICLISSAHPTPNCISRLAQLARLAPDCIYVIGSAQLVRFGLCTQSLIMFRDWLSSLSFSGDLAQANFHPLQVSASLWC